MLNWFGVAVGVILLIAGAVGLAYAAPSVIAMWRVYQMQKKIEASIERAFEQRTADEWAADLDHADPAARARDSRPRERTGSPDDRAIVS